MLNQEQKIADLRTIIGFKTAKNAKKKQAFF